MTGRTSALSSERMITARAMLAKFSERMPGSSQIVIAIDTKPTRNVTTKRIRSARRPFRQFQMRDAWSR